MTDKVVKEIYLSGTAKWCKHKKPDEKYGNYTMDLFMDDKSWAKFNDSGAQLKVRTSDDEETPGNFVTFKRAHSKQFNDELRIFGPPSVIDVDGNDISKDNVGNGSEVTIKVRVYDTRMGKGTDWESMRVETLVPYEGTVIEVDTDISEPF